MKQKAFSILFKGFSLKQIKHFFSEGDDLTLISWLDFNEHIHLGPNQSLRGLLDVSEIWMDLEFRGNCFRCEDPTNTLMLFSANAKWKDEIKSNNEINNIW